MYRAVSGRALPGHREIAAKRWDISTSSVEPLRYGRCFGPGTEVLWCHGQWKAHKLMKILVVDDHVLIRDALRGVLKELKNDAVVLEAGDCRQAMETIAAQAD